MIFNLNGTYIDTKQIQHISDVLAPNQRKFNDSEWSSDNEIDWMWRFEIKFFNDKTSTVFSYVDFNIPYNEAETKIKVIHKQVVDFWKQEQSQIPSVKF